MSQERGLTAMSNQLLQGPMKSLPSNSLGSEVVTTFGLGRFYYNVRTIRSTLYSLQGA